MRTITITLTVQQAILIYNSVDRDWRTNDCMTRRDIATMRRGLDVFELALFGKIDGEDEAAAPTSS